MLSANPGDTNADPRTQEELASALCAARARIAELEEESEAIRAAAAADRRLLQDYVAELRARVDRGLAASTREFAELVVKDAADFQACLEELERAFAEPLAGRPPHN
jgi:hypothetical protein